MDFNGLLEHITRDQQTLDEASWKTIAGSAAIAGALLTGTPQIADAAPAVTSRIEHTQGLNLSLKTKLEKLKVLANKEGIDFKVICGYRSQQEQDRLYAQGRTTPGKKVTWTRNSKHNKGKAFDVAMLSHGKVTWESSEYQRLGQLGKSIGLTWGGDWKSRDLGHFEID
jgi:LAS superfamily LD-carboxypeptidase LdcB